jgi:cytochrome P450
MSDVRHSGRPTVDFDHHSPTSERHPWEAAAELREECPVGWSEHHGGFWVVSRYEDVRNVIMDFANFTSTRIRDPELSSFDIPGTKFPVGLPMELDPPDARPYRRRLNHILSREAVAELEPRVLHWTTHLIDQIIERGACDLAADLATPLPATVSLEWLGMPADVLAPACSSYHEYLGYPPGTPESERGYQNVEWLNQRIVEEIITRRDNPRDDMLSWLVHNDLGGPPLPLDEVVRMTVLLVAAGIDTTTNGITSALVHLGRHPEDRERLRTEPELWTTAVDEFLRRYPPVTGQARTVARDVEFGGCRMQRGDKILPLVSSACHDEDVFPGAQEVVLDRRPNHHLAFGIGTHRCVGMHLARLEIEVVLREVVKRLPEYVLDEDGLAPYPDQATVAGWQKIPVTFTPGQRSTS